MLALTQAWSWPLLGDYRAGVVALTIIGFAAIGLTIAAMVVFGTLVFELVVAPRPAPARKPQPIPA